MKQAVREAFAASITRIFLWAMGLTLLTWAAATRLRDPDFSRSGTPQQAMQPVEM